MYISVSMQHSQTKADIIMLNCYCIDECVCVCVFVSLFTMIIRMNENEAYVCLL
jgi:hypothetical protein